ncbi:MAG: AAA family ATPase [Flavobacterium sp.]|uniref:AAA family ATPase n=1 Tax=Flavobacterium sp. TaxID=239 RepID=UPI003BD4576E
MKNLFKNDLLNSICAVNEHKGHSILEDYDVQSRLKEDLDRIRFFFDIDVNTAAVMAVLLCEQIAGNNFNVNKVMKYLGYKTINILEVNAQLNNLKKKGWIVPNSKNYIIETIDDYQFSKDILNSILLQDKNVLDIIVPNDVIEAMYSIMRFLKNVLVDTDNEYMIETVLQYVEHFRDFPLIDSIFKNKLMNNAEKAVLFYIMSFSAAGVEEFDLNYELEKFCADPSFPFLFMKRVSSEKSILFNEGYLQFNDPFVADFSRVSLGERLRNELDIKDTNINIPFTPKWTQIMLPVDIPSKKLFFNKVNQSQIDEAFKLTSDTYDDIIARFQQHDLASGLTFLLHGTSGTGKTELVKQLAKKNNRVILILDISQMHSIHNFQSIRYIKNLFSEYKAAIKFYERTPILLLNDADAIISNRGVVEKTINIIHNSVLNVLLQELEDFKGIFIATTNRLINIDSAFDHRMLYKLQFEKPSKNTRLSILKHNFKGLPQDLLAKASNDYDFTGAQIDNVKKRCLSEELLFGAEKSITEKFISYIEQEVNFRKTDNLT